jgi:hypothetical protein
MVRVPSRPLLPTSAKHSSSTAIFTSSISSKLKPSRPASPAAVSRATRSSCGLAGMVRWTSSPFTSVTFPLPLGPAGRAR